MYLKTRFKVMTALGLRRNYRLNLSDLLSLMDPPSSSISVLVLRLHRAVASPAVGYEIPIYYADTEAMRQSSFAGNHGVHQCGEDKVFDIRGPLVNRTCVRCAGLDEMYDTHKDQTWQNVEISFRQRASHDSDCQLQRSSSLAQPPTTTTAERMLKAPDKIPKKTRATALPAMYPRN